MKDDRRAPRDQGMSRPFVTFGRKSALQDTEFS
jgi:hypothetical protein